MEKNLSEKPKMSPMSQMQIMKTEQAKKENRISLSFKTNLGNGEKPKTKIDLEVKYKMIDAKLSNAENFAKIFTKPNKIPTETQSLDAISKKTVVDLEQQIKKLPTTKVMFGDEGNKR